MTKYKAIEIANFFVQLANSIPNDSIDNLKINKLLYYTQGHSLVRLNRKMFEENLEAWDFGPVVPDVYRAFSCCGKTPISDPVDRFDESRLSSEELELLTDIYLNYGKYTGVALMQMSHRIGSPWDKVYEKNKNHVISESSMIEEFTVNRLKNSTEELLQSIPIVDAIPKEWDSDEDNIYDSRRAVPC